MAVSEPLPSLPNLLLDANLLVVFVVGNIDRNLLGSAKRVKEYSPDDYDVLADYIRAFPNVITLPNVLTEASNLLRQIRGEPRQLCVRLLADLIVGGTEIAVPSSRAVLLPEYEELGLTDAAILSALDDRTTLLTADLGLYVAALSRDLNAQRFERSRD